ncbi:hypothetical protein RHSIM_Rhsim12G0045900 [Rhododendron simsii]|uniref:Jacalin-type lectin domain-containing protein n=1 Tax=Rhododendron simsii TaxID=118357 RepID=A0A834G943_RHOSS|nr:hypothetical protein RHSIM_Rhsim12G0045900 [Rhododendron simsii]
MGIIISSPQAFISLGPWGGKGGVYSEYKLAGPIMQITIRHGDVIDSILFESKNRDGGVIGSPVKIGGTGGGSSAKIIEMAAVIGSKPTAGFSIIASGALNRSPSPLVDLLSSPSVPTNSAPLSLPFNFASARIDGFKDDK